MIQAKRVDTDSGWTLPELMTVVAIIGLLSAISIFSYMHFTQKARAVEADMALAEVTRLEEVFFSATGAYSSDLDAIGFKPNPPLQYHQVSVVAVNGPDGHMFQVTVGPLSGTGNEQPRSVTRYAENQAAGKKSADDSLGGGQGRTSTVTSTGSGGGSEFRGEGWSDEGIEKADTGTYQPGQGRKVVSHGPSTGGGMSAK